MAGIQLRELKGHIRDDRLRILARPNARKNAVLGYDAVRDAVKVAIAAPAEDNKANIALLKFIGRSLDAPVALISGARGKLKVLRILERVKLDL